MVQFYEDPILMGILVSMVVCVLLICICFCYCMLRKEKYDSHTGRFVGVISIDKRHNVNKYYRRNKQLKLSKNPMMDNKDQTPLQSLSVISSPATNTPLTSTTVIAPKLIHNNNTVVSPV